MGRPTTYKDVYPDNLVNQMSEGKFDYEIYADWNISKNTFYRWLNEYPELKEAYDLGWVKCHKWWTTKGKERFAERDEKGFKYWIAIMNNKFQWGRDELSGKTGQLTVNIAQVNVLNQKSPEQLLEFIQEKLEEHKDIIDTELLPTSYSVIPTSNDES